MTASVGGHGGRGPSTSALDHATFDAFVSYRSETSGFQARRVSGELFELARRHPREHSLRLFIDVNALGAGDLGHRIERALENSRNLVVLLDLRTPESRWVRKEIEHWLSHGGSPERLFLVRTDKEVDLSWDELAQDFAVPEGVPEPLRRLFSGEQKWFDAPGAWWRSEPGSLAGLYAAIVDVHPEELLVEETRLSRQRQRRARLVVTALSALLVVAVIAGFVALAMSRSSVASAKEARAQAAAASALLTLPYSMPRAIEDVLRAADDDEGQAVRAAMIAVADGTSALRRTLDYDALGTGRDPTGAAFSLDGSRLLVWGPARGEGRSHLVSWSVSSGRAVLDGDVPVAGVRDVVDAGMPRLAACSDGGPVFIDRVSLAVTSALPTEALQRSSVDASCRTAAFRSGALIELMGLSEDLWSVVVFAPTTNAPPMVFPDATLGPIDPRSMSVPLLTAEGLEVLGGGGAVRPNLPSDAEVLQGTDDGQLLVRSDASYYRVAYVPGQGKALVHRLDVPVSAVSVALYAYLGEGYEQAVWMDANGLLGVVGGDASAQLDPGLDALGRPAEPEAGGFAASVVSGQAEQVVALFGSRVYSVTAPTEYADDFVVRTLDVVVNATGGDAHQTPLRRCSGGSTVSVGDGAYLLPDLQGISVLQPQGEDVYVGDNCRVVDPGPPLTIDGFPVTESVLDGEVVTAAPGGWVALLQPGRPIQVLTVGVNQEKPWRSVTRQASLTALGERLVVSDTDGPVSVATNSGVVERLALPSGNLKVPRPDGRGGVFERTGADGGLVATSGVDSAELSPRCEDQLTYLPGRAFAEATDDATEQNLVSYLVDGTILDCVSGEEADWDGRLHLLQYEVGRSGGRILWWREAASGGGTEGPFVTTWGGTDGPGPITRPVPDVGTVGYSMARYDFDPSGTQALVTTEGDGVIRPFIWRDEGWVEQPVLQSSVGPLAGAAWSPDLALAIGIGSNGGFDVFDVATGSRLVTDTRGRAGVSGTVGSVGTIERDGFLYIYVANGNNEAPISSAVIQLPVSAGRLKELLCGIHVASSCTARIE